MDGTVKKLVKDKGFGFIRADDGSEWFFHRSTMAGGPRAFDGLKEGAGVSFQPTTSPKGPRAEDVELY